MKREKFVVFREEINIAKTIDKIAQKQGIDRSDFIRQAIREKLQQIYENRREAPKHG